MVYPSPSAGIISGPFIICIDTVFALTETVPGGTWSGSNSTVAAIESANGIVHIISPGASIITYTVGSGTCNGIATFTVTMTPQLNVTSLTKNDLCNAGTGSISIEVTGGTTPYSYLWSNNKTGNEITGLIAGVYSVSVTDINSCAKNIYAEVKEDSCNAIVIHDVITPNGDGINETWVIEGLSLYSNNTVQVFDKWGDIVYEKTNYKNDWGGKGKSGLLPDGTYDYLVKLNAPNLKGGQNVFTGTVLIKR